MCIPVAAQDRDKKVRAALKKETRENRETPKAHRHGNILAEEDNMPVISRDSGHCETCNIFLGDAKCFSISVHRSVRDGKIVRMQRSRPPDVHVPV